MNPEIGKIRSLFLERVRHFGPRRESLCVVLGAGADISSGGLTFRELKKACLQTFKETSAISLLSDDDIDWHFDTLLRESDRDSQRAAILDFIFHGLDSGTPSDGYKLLILLAREGIINSVVTTNFDDLLEIAQREMRLDVFQVYAPGVASPFVVEGRAHLPPRPIYVKVHGDIRAKFVTHVTRQEIRGRRYQEDFSILLRQIFSTHRIVFVGYGGSDEIFAQELEAVADSIPQPVYWCNKVPLNPNTPLALAFRQVEMRFVHASFEEVFTEGAVTCLGAASPLEASVQFVAPLIRERYRLINDHFLSGLPNTLRSARLTLLIPRKSVHEKLAVFRTNSSKPLAVLTGSSGVGKSAALAYLCDSLVNHEPSTLIAIRARSIASTDFARDLVERLGYTSENPLALLYHFSGWLRARSQQLTIAVDGLNEFHPSNLECLTLFREILRVALWLQHHGAIKILVTVRPESWNEIYSFIDVSDLVKVLWTADHFKDKITAIHLDRFDQDELVLAYDSYARHFSVATPFRHVDEASRTLLSDPYLLALAMQNRETIGSYTLGYDISRKAHQEVLRSSFGNLKAQSIEVSLARLTGFCLRERATSFSIDALHAVGISLEQIPVLREVNIFSQIDATSLCFSHDRVHECYLAMAISELSEVRVLSHQDLLKALRLGVDYPRLHSALRQCFVDPPPTLVDHHTNLMFEVLELSLSQESFYSRQDLRLLHEFAKDTVFTIAANSPVRFCEIAQNFFDRTGDESRAGIARVLLHACCLLKPERCASLMIGATRSTLPLLHAEAIILIYDKIVSIILGEPRRAYEELTSGCMSPFFFGDGIAPIERVMRLLGLVSQLGSDNTHPSEWHSISRAMLEVFRSACDECRSSSAGLSSLPDLVVRNANRYLFNAAEDIVSHYFMSPSRKALLVILEDLERGAPITLSHVSKMRDFVCELGQTIEFIICNLLFILSMKLDAAKTMETFEEYFSTFNEYTNPEEVDFFLSALCLSHLTLSLPVQDKVTKFAEEMLTKCPQAILLNPGAIRGQRRGRFTDPFDQQFEDGFNPLAFYFYSAPSTQRRSMAYSDYLKKGSHDEDLLPLYWKCLDQFEAQNSTVGSLRVVHALGQMISLWPIEGLIALHRIVGRTEPVIRRAIIRVLAESYARFPAETMLLMAQSGSAFTDDEKYEIKCGTDPRLSERSFEQLQWSRILLFLDSMDTSGKFLWDVTSHLVRSTSFAEAVESVFRRVLSAPLSSHYSEVKEPS